MSSVRPKLAPAAPRIVTAWDTRTGRTVYLGECGRWVSSPAQASVLSHETVESALAAARADQCRVNDAYAMEVTASGEIAGREALRETLRARGPSVHPHLGRQAGNP